MITSWIDKSNSTVSQNTSLEPWGNDEFGRRGVMCATRWHPILVVFGSFFEGWSQTLPSTKLFCLDLNKAVPPWRRKSWRKRYSNTMRMQNQAKLAEPIEGTCQSQYYVPALICDLHWSATAMPAASCAQLLFGCVFVCLFVCLFVRWNETRKTILRLLCWEGSKPPGSDHTRVEAQTTCVPKTAAQNTYLSIEARGGGGLPTPPRAHWIGPE